MSNPSKCAETLIRAQLDWIDSLIYNTHLALSAARNMPFDDGALVRRLEARLESSLFHLQASKESIVSIAMKHGVYTLKPECDHKDIEKNVCLDCGEDQTENLVCAAEYAGERNR